MDDNAIIDLFWQRSENAIRQTDIKYGALCTSLAGNILHNPSDTEECVSDSYLTVWNRIPEERPSHFQAFLCKIVKNHALDRVKYLTAQKRNPGHLDCLDELADCVSGGDAPEDELDAKELGHAISRFLRTLNKTDMRIFLRRYWYCDSVKDIAADYGMSEDKISGMLYRTRRKLKKFLGKEGYRL